MPKALLRRWLKEHAWKVCKHESASWVRILSITHEIVLVLMKYYAYILKSDKDQRYYYGSTSNMAERLKKHNAGGVPSTKHRRPLQLIYQEEFDNKALALNRELFFKSIDGYKWLKENQIT